MNNLIRVFIGYDPREAVAFSVLSYSIQRRATQPVSITPLILNQLAPILYRKRDPLQSTDFSFSRFLVPLLSNYEGWSIFLDCDMIILDDIAKLWALRDERFAVMVVKNNHSPNQKTKFLNEPQSKYDKKNWSSVMIFNNSKCKSLTQDYVNTATGLDLHQFKWLDSEGLIGSLSSRWNHLVGYSIPSKEVSLVHFTNGGPYFREFSGCEHSDTWFNEKSKMLYPLKVTAEK